MLIKKSINGFFILVLFCICTSIGNSQIEWNKNSENPILIPGGIGSWDETSAVVNTVLFHENVYKMWYEGDGGFGYATSPDGISWTKDSLHNPVLQPGPPDSWDEMEINNASVLIKDNLYHMWYSGIDLLDDNRIGHATSPDGINWTKDSLNPVLDLGAPGSWDDEEVIHPFVIYENDTLKMWYNGHDGITQRILFATSQDGRNWVRYTQHPMLEPGFGGAWDSKELGPLSVVHEENLYHMWYTGWNYADYIQIGYATSPDGTDWTKNSLVLSPGDPGEWDEGAVALPFVLFDSVNSLFRMWYGGTDGILFQTGSATSEFTAGVDNNSDEMPEQFALLQNFPNPFNPKTKISWQSPVSGWQTLIVYDILGREVETLVNEYKPAGKYEIEFSAGEEYASGLYFYQLKAIPVGGQVGDPSTGSGQVFVQTNKMILLK